MSPLRLPDALTDDEGARLLRRIRGEYAEMPGLKLTPAQAARLWWLDAARCDALLTALVDSHELVRRPDGTYVRADSPRR